MTLFGESKDSYIDTCLQDSFIESSLQNDSITSYSLENIRNIHKIDSSQDIDTDDSLISVDDNYASQPPLDIIVRNDEQPHNNISFDNSVSDNLTLTGLKELLFCLQSLMILIWIQVFDF